MTTTMKPFPPYRTRQRGEGQAVHSVDGRVIGHIEGSTFHKRIKEAVHILRRPPGIAVDEKAFVEEVLPCCEAIEVKTDKGRIFTVSTTRFNDNCFPIDRGYGRQLVLPLAKWRLETDGGRQLAMEGF